MCAYTYIGVCRCVNLRNGKSDSVRLRCDANALRMRCDAKLCVRVKRRDFRSWGFKWAMAVAWRAVPWRDPPIVALKSIKSNEIHRNLMKSNEI